MESRDTEAHSADTIPRRTVNACIQCRSQKIRCDGKAPSCGRCLNSKTACRYGKRNGRGLGKSKQYIQLLEQRLKEAETTLQPSVDLDEVVHNSSAEIGNSDNTHHVNETTVPEITQTLITRWSREITTNIIHAQQHMSNFERTAFIPLPPKEHMIHFISNALEDINQVWPLFSIPEALKLVDDQCAAGLSNFNDNPTRWATLNALMAVCIHWKVDNQALEELLPISWEYFKNSYAAFPELVMISASVESCQAMLVMALFMLGTADAQAFTSLLSAATHVGQCIGLHVKDVTNPSECTDLEKRRRMFWLIHVLQCDASIKFGLPPPSGEVDIELPSLGPPVGSSFGTNLLRHMSTMSLIQSKISRYLRPASGLWEDHDKMFGVLTELDNDLDSWFSGLPSDLLPMSLTKVVDRCIVQLHFTYYASSWRIHAASTKLLELRNGVASTATRQMPHGFFLKSPTPIYGARATISLLQTLPPQPFVLLWQMICYPVCAVMILFAAVVDNPGDSEVDFNAAFIGKFVRYLQDFQDREGCDLKALVDGCSKLRDIASFAKYTPGAQRHLSGNSAVDPWQQYEYMRMRLRSSTDLMQLAQGLLTNMPLLCSEATEAFSGIYEERDKDGFGLLVPDILKPSRFRFIFKSK